MPPWAVSRQSRQTVWVLDPLALRMVARGDEDVLGCCFCCPDINRASGSTVLALMEASSTWSLMGW